MEPEGTVEIKYRQRDLLKTVHRCDSECANLLHQLQAAQSDTEKEELNRQLKKREELLLPLYHTVAVQFANLHDTPGRMLEKGVIAVSLIPGINTVVIFVVTAQEQNLCSTFHF